VYVYDGFQDDFDMVEKKSRANIEATIREQYCLFGRVSSNERWNNNEGRYTVKNKNLLVQAVKHFQTRVYGVEGSVDGKRAFFVSAIEPAKKKDKADRGALKRAANSAHQLAESISKAKV